MPHKTIGRLAPLAIYQNPLFQLGLAERVPSGVIQTTNFSALLAFSITC